MKFHTSNHRTFVLFAPLALSVFVLVPALYFGTHETPAGQTAAAGPQVTSAMEVSSAPVAEVSSAPVIEKLSAPRAGRNFTDADFARHVAALKKKLPGREFTIVIQRPFVVVGDGTPAAVRTQSQTVRWAVDKLKQDFFTKDPAEILDVWLFKDEASYRKHARQLFNDEPDTPYGYYSSTHKALVMNIETGGGTLVHEIVHPFVEANFPEAPPWLNEGLGSLYEQSGEEDGHIYGYPNWRLPGLQAAIKDRAVPTFKELMAMNANAFYYHDKGTNYGQSRYLLYYLQERGLLVKFYKEFYDRRKDDPTGHQTLQTILGESDMTAFQKKWEKFVLDLSQGFTVRVPAS
ncbi:MAG TPA: hypothetical protein VJ715_03620 [Pyrinomonadaceae bacterium]|nr:hypothetical protein [Pyrinomonadaceae bacterium]